MDVYTGELFVAVKAGMNEILILLRTEQRDIAQNARQLLATINTLCPSASKNEQGTSGGALVIAARMVSQSATTEERLFLAPIFSRGLELMIRFKTKPSFYRQNIQFLLRQYLDIIPRDTPGATLCLDLVANVFVVLNHSPTLNDDFFSFANILTIGRVITTTLEIIKNGDRDIILRKKALEVLTQLVRQCPPEKAPVIGMVVSGILAGLHKVTKGAVNAALLENTIRLFTDAVVLVFANDAVKFNRHKINEDDFKGEMHSFVDNHNDKWRSDSVPVISSYVKDILSSYLLYRVDGVKNAVCDMVYRIQQNCDEMFDTALHAYLFQIYIHLRFDEYEHYQEIAISCLGLIKDKVMIEEFFYEQLEETCRRLPVRMRSHTGDTELNALAAQLAGLDDAVTLMFTTGSRTIEDILRCLADCIVIKKRSLMISSGIISECLDQELRKFRLEFGLYHQSVKQICKVLAELGKLELIAMMHSLMQEESSGRRASYHLMLAYMMQELNRDITCSDDPVILMLAEFLVEEANNAYSVDEIDDANPHRLDYENDWDKCLESLSCINVALCMQFMGVTANRSHISVNCLSVILNQTMSRTWFISETAAFSLKILTESDENVSNVRELVRLYSSHILNSVALACCSSDDYHMAPHLLQAYLRHAAIGDQFDQFQVIVEKMLHALDSNEQEFTVAILQALLSFLKSLNSQFPDIYPITPAEGAEDHRSLPVPQLSITEKILLRTKHMLTSPHLSVRLICLDILGEGIDILKHYDDMLLPMIHQNWHGVMSIVREEEPIAMNSVLDQIVNMADKAGTFIHNKVLREFWPAAENFLVNCIRKENLYQHSADYHLLVKYIDRVPFLVVNTGLTEQEANESLVKILDLAIREERNFVSFSKTQKEQLSKYFKDLAANGENK